ncbi:hypothetical protein ATY41_05610 [Leifsonia xyli subsp. xyli]|nr:hypothetical protein [Leifsonia xyli]ODA89391.1 hypothetical protein ATY41_05610 [Leifsonia xyli subsp. xyli]
MGQAAAVVDAGERVLELQARIRAMQGTRLDERRLPTLEAIAPLLPGGALMTGAVYSVAGSMTLLQGMLAGIGAAVSGRCRPPDRQAPACRSRMSRSVPLN